MDYDGPTIYVPENRIVKATLSETTRLVGTFGHRVWRDGELLHDWSYSYNLVPDVMEDHYLDVALSAATQETSWFVGLTDGTPTTDETDTMASHAGWTEVTDYDEASRPSWAEGGVSGQSIDNSGTPAAFSINASVTVGGAFLTSDSTKAGTAGILGAVSAFGGGDRSLQSGDTLEITYTMQMAGT